MVDLKEEQKYERLRKLGQELHIPIPEAFWELVVFDKEGKLVQRHRQRSHSWSRNAYNLLLSQMANKNLDDADVFGAGLLSIKNTAAAIKDGGFGATVNHSGTNFENVGTGYRAAAAGVANGILVGSDNGAWTFEQYVLLDPITEGTGEGQLNAILMAVPTKSYNGGAKTWTITWIRYFNNNTVLETDVLVKEVAIVTYGKVDNANHYFLMSRDVLGTTVTVPSTGQLKVTYTIQLTYPA